MKARVKRGLVVGLAACMAAASLAGCGKGKELDTTATVATLDGEKIPVGLANCLFRYQQAQFETYYGSWLKSYYGDDIWSADLTGTGTAYGDSFKDEIMTSLEKMLLAEKHMDDYGVEITEEDKAAIAAAAEEFIAANGEEVLKKMSATAENVERMLTLYTIEHEMEHAMGADVDTEVSDEEAAQRTVSYVRFDVKSEEETEEETEAGSEESTEASETEKETAPAETSSEAAVTEAEATKTESADATEAETEAVTENAAEAETEAVSENTTEAATEEETEAETEDEETRAAKAEAKERAEAFLAVAKEADDFAAAAAEVTEIDADASTSSYTFGDDDTYPDEAIINATKDLEDGTVVDEVIEVNDSYYVLHVDDAFDEEAVEAKKEEIIAARRQEAVDALYEEWMDAAEFTVDEEVYAKLIFDIALTIESEEATEADTEATTEETTEAGTEKATEAATEAGTEKATEAETEAAETEK